MIPLGPPHALICLVQRVVPGIVLCGRTREKVIALTLDDGPHAMVTPNVLDTLRAHHATATFFLIGSRVVATDRGVVERIVREGHELGNHTWSDRCSALMKPGDLVRSVRRTHEALADFGAPIRLFRPGAGWVTPWVLAAARPYRYRCVLGSVYPQDVRVRSEERIVADVLARARPGAIVVLHEGTLERARVTRILDRILTDLRACGYRFTTVSDLLTPTAG